MSTGVIKRGDRVTYKGVVYFARPNGTSCYLFLHEADMDDVTKADAVPRRDQVTLYAPAIPPPPPGTQHPLTVPDEETDEAERLIVALTQAQDTKWHYVVVETRVHGIYATCEEAEAALPPGHDSSATFAIVKTLKSAK